MPRCSRCGRNPVVTCDDALSRKYCPHKPAKPQPGPDLSKQGLVDWHSRTAGQIAQATAALLRMYVPDDVVVDGGKVYRVTRVEKVKT